MFCELIAGSLFKKNKLLAAFLFILLLVGLPLITLILFVALVWVGYNEFYKKFLEDLSIVVFIRDSICSFYRPRYSDVNLFIKFLQYLYNVVIGIIVFAFFSTLGAISGALGSIALVISIGPLYILFFLSTMCLLKNWSKRNILWIFNLIF